VTSITALGDSVPYGTACHCHPYPQLTATDIAQAAARHVGVSNDAVPGYESRNVVDQLEHDATVRRDVAGSQAVLIEIGANDVGYSSSCGTTVSCYTPKVPEIEQNLTTIVHDVHTLTNGQPLAVVLLDYWNVWLGGQYAESQGEEYVLASDTVTDQVDDVIQAVARSTDSIYVDLRTAFRGPDRSWDETHLLASDGDHPNADGHERIAEAIEQTVAEDETR
jgi:lysophospholipase L1-like esterase